MEITSIDNKVKQVVSNIRNLPTPPIVFHQIQKVMSNPDVSAAQIASILSEDPAMSAKVLKLTNSAFYGLAREVDSVKHAVVNVGIEAIKNLVLSASVLDMFKGGELDKEFHEKHWRHSLATGFCCRMLASKLKKHGFVNSDSAFSAGLLHDIGKMVIVCYLQDDYAKVGQERELDKQSMDWEIEKRVLGYTHAEVGAVLIQVWKLPEKMGEAIFYHHNPLESNGEEVMPYLINLSNYLSNRTFLDEHEKYLAGSVDPAVLEFLGTTEEELEQYTEGLKAEYVKAETFMQIAGIG